MLTTSVSLPVKHAQLWRAKQRQIMRLTTRMLRSLFTRMPVRRGSKRLYNRTGEDFQIVTTRFTETEYDTLHCAAAALRVSVSWLVYCLIKLWLKPSQRVKTNLYTTNYYMTPHTCGPTALIFTESIYFRRNTAQQNISSVSQE